jgi:chitin disaccharide deacetylase
MQTKHIIMTADDYAQSAEIDQGILNLIRMGRLTATSCLTLSPRWHKAAQQLTPDIRQLADIGLHLDFTHYPQTLRHNLATLIAKATLRLLPAKQIRQSIQTQLDAFEHALGTAPDYVDGHQHVHQLPQIREVLMDELSKRYPTNLPWIRIAKPPMRDGFKAIVIRSLGATGLERLAIAKRLPYSKTLLGIYGFNLTADQYKQQFTGWMKNADSVSEPVAFMCHPAIGTLSLPSEDDPIFSARLQEYTVFSDVQFKSLLDQNNVTLVRGSQLMSSQVNQTK